METKILTQQAFFLNTFSYKQLVINNYATAKAVARKNRSYKANYSDLEQEEVIGTCKAVYKFDSSYGVKLKTFAEYDAKPAKLNGQ